jgi:hypothetical protein
MLLVSRSNGISIINDYLIDGCEFNEVQFSDRIRPSSIAVSQILV